MSWENGGTAPSIFTFGTGKEATKIIFSREFLEYANLTKFQRSQSRIFENETCKRTDEHPSLTQEIVPGVDDVTTSADRNMVAEEEVEQSSSCHVRDVCAAEQNTSIIATVTTLQYEYETFRYTKHSQWGQPSTAGRPASLPS